MMTLASNLLVTIGSALLMMHVAAHFTPLYSRLLVNAHVCVFVHVIGITPTPFHSLPYRHQSVLSTMNCI
jgi:hypothetical protein